MNKVSKIICIVLSSILALVLITAIDLGIIGKKYYSRVNQYFA